jgi:uncharacterized protein (DUF3820 family)
MSFSPDHIEPLQDNDWMPFGKYSSHPNKKKMIEVPAHYLLYLREKGWITDKRVKQYVEDNLEALKKEAGGKR